jgi:hypothetical protein
VSKMLIINKSYLGLKLIYELECISYNMMYPSKCDICGKEPQSGMKCTVKFAVGESK